MCILAGFPTTSAKEANDSSLYPFGIWFANPDTLYVADEGAGDATFSNGMYTAAAASTTAGLQKWVFNGTQWDLAYTIQSGLNLGVPYQVANGPQGQVYPMGENSYVNSAGQTVDLGNWAPANDGLRNLTGRVNANGTVDLWATTSTVSGGGDQGADPNSLVAVTDDLAATTLPTGEGFWPSLHRRTDRLCGECRSLPGQSSRGRGGSRSAGSPWAADLGLALSSQGRYPAFRRAACPIENPGRWRSPSCRPLASDSSYFRSTFGTSTIPTGTPVSLRNPSIPRTLPRRSCQHLPLVQSGEQRAGKSGQ